MNSSISRIRANKKTFNVSDDTDFDDAVNTARRRARDAVEKFDAGFDDDKTIGSALGSSSIKKSSYKVSDLWSDDFINDFMEFQGRKTSKYNIRYLIIT